MGVLAGRVVVVTDPAAARAVAEGDAAVVIVSQDPDAAVVVSELEQDGRRVAHFTGDLAQTDDRAALGEMIAELFPPASDVELA